MSACGNRIGVLVVTYNQCDLTERFIGMFQGIFGQSGLYLLVLDNNSSDGTVERLRRRFDSVDIRKLNDNYGCVTGRNIGIVELYRLGCDTIYISDNDIVILDPDFFHKMEVFLSRQPDVDGCCPVVRWGDDGTIQTLGSRRVNVACARNVSSVGSNHDVHTLPGCAQFIRVEAFKKYGLFDNDLAPLSLEDYEWGMRASEMNARLCYNPDAEVFHFHDRTRKDTPEKMGHLITGRMVYLRKHFSMLRLFQEMVFLLRAAKTYGILFVLGHYRRGIVREICNNLYGFDDFLRDGFAKYSV